AENDEAGLLFVGDSFKDLCDRERLDDTVGLYQDAAVGAHREAGADRLGALLRADRDAHHLGGLAGVLPPQPFFHAELVEWIHRHLDVGELDARTVALDADLHVVINDPLDWHKNLHRSPGPLLDLQLLCLRIALLMGAEPTGPLRRGQRAKHPLLLSSVSLALPKTQDHSNS